MNQQNLARLYGEEYVARAVIYHDQLCDRLEQICFAGRAFAPGAHWVDEALDLIDRARGKK
jgi:hypothetical protein